MENSIFVNSKNVFLDTVNPKDYVQLDRVSTIYQSLKDSIKKPLKMILLYGKPGTGKSMFLTKLSLDLAETQNVFLYDTPILDESEFYKTLAQDLFDVKYRGELNFTQFMKIVDEHIVDDVQDEIADNFDGFFTSSDMDEADYHIAITTTLTTEGNCLNASGTQTCPIHEMCGHYTACSGNDRFLTNTKMHRSANQTTLSAQCQSLLSLTNSEHRFKHCN